MQTLPCSANAAVAPSFPFQTEDHPPLSVNKFLVTSHSTTQPSSHVVTGVDDKDDDWSPDLSSTLYRIDKWGPPYYSVNDEGNISVYPNGLSTLPYQEVDLLKIIKKISDEESAGGLELQLPAIVQFPEVLKCRVDCLNNAFNNAIESQGYQSRYQGVYPIKCNQHRFIVEDIVKFGYQYKFGLEAGTKPELLLALHCLSKGHPDAFLVCNGFKDCEFIYLALIARKLNYNTYIVLELEEEIDIVIDLSRKLRIEPVIGIRAKLRTQHDGHYGPTSGERGKFGLSTTQIMRVAHKLKREGMLSSLKLLHFHIGSQIPTKQVIHDAVTEASQIYCDLAEFGADMQIIDCGGGLGIDYDGSMSGESDHSVEYTMEEYAEVAVKAVRDVCDSNKINHPVICTESGRAVVSHQSILVFEVVSSREYVAPSLSASAVKHLIEGFSKDVREHYNKLHVAAVRGEKDICLHHTKQLKKRCLEQFMQGSLSMEHLAAVDGLCKLISKAVEEEDPDQYYQVNLSMFASIVDFVLIGQLFPIVPIHRLGERPTIKGVLSDLTCDSDGKINKFIGDRSNLPLHEFEIGGSEKYYLGMFLGGAYEEALGGVHNLLGSVTIVQVEQSDSNDGFTVRRSKPGQSSRDLLLKMDFDPDSVLETIRQRAGNSDVTNGLESFFDKMPYLVGSTSSCVDNALKIKK